MEAVICEIGFAGRFCPKSTLSNTKYRMDPRINILMKTNKYIKTKTKKRILKQRDWKPEAENIAKC